eukprot:scaffold19441_cov214-Skeletonema_marinoi.AAC.5
MDDLPEFDAESLFGNWSREDNAECTTNVDDTSGGGLIASSKANLTSAHLNQILDAAETPNGGDDTYKDGGGGGDESSNLGSSSTSVNNNFTFPMYYPLNQGRNHPLAMTSMASCPPYANAATTAAPSTSSSAQSIALESSGLQSLMSQQPQQQQHQAQQQLALATAFNAANNNTNSNNNASNGNSSGNINGNNITASTLSYNSPYSTHLSELTANFRNNPNVSVHYGMAVNGFHPQVNARVNPVFPLSNNGRICGATAAAPQQARAGGAGNRSTGTNNSRKQSRGKGNANATITNAAGTASTHTRNSRERNNREQVRAQKITQLISELRENMEQDGWQEEMKSKYQTLSQCKDYVEYLMRYHKEKEADIARTKKLVKEKVLSEARSGHLSDSVTSSLTAFTTRSTSPGSDSKESSLSSEYQERKHRKKRKKQEEEEGAINDDGDDVPKRSKKGRRSSGHKQMEEAQQQQSSTDSSYEDDEDDDSPGGRNISFDKACSSVSDMTDSNKSSTTNNNTKSSTGSISSTAAVVRGVGSSQHTPSHHQHRRRSHSPRREAESNSMSAVKEEEQALADETGGDMPQKKKKKRGFDYDYREAFLNSSVPQLIATLSGRIVATGLNKRDIGRLTIFSIVQSDQLSKLYKMVARALAEQHVAPNIPLSESTSASGMSCKENVISTKPKGVGSGGDWQVVTLKCVRFPSSKNEGEKHPLFLTITLMGDANRDQRCFHVTLSDTPSDEGQFGTISPKLLTKMFAPVISAGAGKGY